MELDVVTSWQLQGLHGCYRVYIIIYRVCVAVTGSMWHLLEGCQVRPVTATFIQ